MGVAPLKCSSGAGDVRLSLRGLVKPDPRETQRGTPKAAHPGSEVSLQKEDTSRARTMMASMMADTSANRRHMGDTRTRPSGAQRITTPSSTASSGLLMRGGRSGTSARSSSTMSSCESLSDDETAAMAASSWSSAASSCARWSCASSESANASSGSSQGGLLSRMACAASAWVHEGSRSACVRARRARKTSEGSAGPKVSRNDGKVC